MAMISGPCVATQPNIWILANMSPCILFWLIKPESCCRTCTTAQRNLMTILTGKYPNSWQINRLIRLVVNRISAATVVESTYGHAISSNSDAYIKLAAEAVALNIETGVTGLNAVDLFPIRKLKVSSLRKFCTHQLPYSSLSSVMDTRNWCTETSQESSCVSWPNGECAIWKC